MACSTNNYIPMMVLVLTQHSSFVMISLLYFILTCGELEMCAPCRNESAWQLIIVLGLV